MTATLNVGRAENYFDACPRQSDCVLTQSTWTTSSVATIKSYLITLHRKQVFLIQNCDRISDFNFLIFMFHVVFYFHNQYQKAIQCYFFITFLYTVWKLCESSIAKSYVSNANNKNRQSSRRQVLVSTQTKQSQNIISYNVHKCSREKSDIKEQ